MSPLERAILLNWSKMLFWWLAKWFGVAAMYVVTAGLICLWIIGCGYI